MNKVEIISFIRQNKCAVIAELQKKFDVSYIKVKKLIDEMVSDGSLVYGEGVRYNYVGLSESELVGVSGRLKRYKARAENRARDADGTEGTRPQYKTLSEYLESRRKIIEQTDKDEDDDELDADTDESEIDEDELRRKALKICIDRGMASVSMLQRVLPIGYSKACSLVDWMEEQGYITSQRGPWARKVLITSDEYDELYPYNLFDDDDDDDYDEEDDEDEAGKSIADRKETLREFKYFFGDDGFNTDKAPSRRNTEELKPSVQSLVNILNGISAKKKMPVCADIVPEHGLWTDEAEFTEAVMDRMKMLIKSDVKMGKQGAVKKAEAYLEAVRDTHDGKMVQVYERLVYEIKNTSAYLYGQLKKQLCAN